MSIRVAFLVFYVEAWDSLAQSYELMSRDPRFETQVFAIPRKLTGATDWDDASGVSNFLNEAGVSHEVLAAKDDGASAAARLREWAPDYTFVNYPWQRNYQRALRPDALAQFTRIAYVPYFSLSLVKEPDGRGGFIDGLAPHYYTQRMHQLASLIFVQSTDVKLAFESTQRGSNGVVVVGSPKLDALAAEYRLAVQADKDRKDADRPRVVFAPHHSYSPHWLNFGTFAKTKDALLALAQSQPEVEFVLRAHPFMWGTLVDREVLTADEVSTWQREWNALPNTTDASNWSLAQVFDCDVLVSDGISFLAEYPLVTGRSGLFIERTDHWPFTPLGQLAARANLTVHWQSTPAVLAEAITQIRSNAHLKASELGELQRAAVPHAGQSANRIVEAVLSHWNLNPGLVDASALTEVPWELQDGREPQD